VAIEVQRFSVIVPAGTAKASPLTFNLPMPPRTVEKIVVVVPPGPRGEVGYQIGSGSVQVIPVTPGAFEVTDNEEVAYDLTDLPNSGAWSLIAYNTGTFNHTLGVRFYVSLPADASAPLAFQPVALS
jgi:hypothetical protein